MKVGLAWSAYTPLPPLEYAVIPLAVADTRMPAPVPAFDTNTASEELFALSRCALTAVPGSEGASRAVAAADCPSTASPVAPTLTPLPLPAFDTIPAIDDAWGLVPDATIASPTPPVAYTP